MQFDYAATAMRPAWSDLPEVVRAGMLLDWLIERRDLS